MIGPEAVTLSWDINVTTLLTFAAGALTFYAGVIRTGEKTRGNGERIEELAVELKTERDRITTLNAAFSAYRETVAREFCAREVMRDLEERVTSHIRDVEGRVTRAIEGLGDRLNHPEASGRVRRLPP